MGLVGASAIRANEDSGQSESIIRWISTAAILFSLALQAWLIFVQEFNWDEFFFLGFVHDYLRGEMNTALQTIHVHIFAPLAGLPGNEVEQIIVGRLVMLTLEAVTFAALYGLFRLWAGRSSALLALALYALMPMTLQHGASFRTDPLALALAMAALAWFARAPQNWKSAVAIGLLLALAVMVTVKVIFFAPAFAGVALWRMAKQSAGKPLFLRIGGIGVSAGLMLLLIYGWHQASLAAATVSDSSTMLQTAAQKTLFDTQFFPRLDVLIDSFRGAPVQWWLLLAAVIALSAALLQGRDRPVAGAVLLCAAPLACLVIYRNAYPYFMPFILAPAFAAVAWFFESRRWSAGLQAILLAAVLGITAFNLERIAARGQEKQRAVISAVHAIFPEPVSMIDRSHLISTFPKRGFFMSTWGMSKYREGKPIFARILDREAVPLLLLDSPVLADAVGAGAPEEPRLLDEDRAVLAGNYIPHWGPIWVAGKHVSVSPRDGTFEIRVPGPYTLEGQQVLLNGRPIAPGQTVDLSRGLHRISSSSIGLVTLRWGRHLSRPMGAPPDLPLFEGF